jgi:hypothetical protein
MRLAKRGALNQERLQALERSCLTALRAYDRDELGLEETLERVLAYSTPATLGAMAHELPGSRKAGELRERYARTLRDRPWKRCTCAICRALSIEVVIFRASNRNKRRGIHNLGIYKGLVDGLPETPAGKAGPDLFSGKGAAKPDTHSALLRGQRG